MDSGSMILDSIRCCEETHKQLLLIQGRNRCATPALVPTEVMDRSKADLQVRGRRMRAMVQQEGRLRSPLRVQAQAAREVRRRCMRDQRGGLKMVDLDRDRFY